VEEESKTKDYRIHYLLYFKEHHHTLEHPSHHLVVVVVELMIVNPHSRQLLRVNKVCLVDLEEEVLLIKQMQVVPQQDNHSQELLE
jgi:hypothetical protein